MNGAKAIISIECDSDLETTASIVAKSLSLPPFSTKSDTDPPHKVVAMTECMGFELWLEEMEGKEKRTYELEIESSIVVLDREEAVFRDISECISKILKIESKLLCSPKK